MIVKVWWIWMVIAAIFAIGEMFTAGFFLLWFSIGAAIAGILAMLGAGDGWQWGAFLVISGVLFTISRKFAERVTKKQPPGIGADRFIGKKGVVLEEINNIKNTGRVRIDNEEWLANSDTNAFISTGEKVEVIRVVGTHLVVKRLTEGE